LLCISEVFRAGFSVEIKWFLRIGQATGRLLRYSMQAAPGDRRILHILPCLILSKRNVFVARKSPLNIVRCNISSTEILAM
jgi:hypothetical protein